MLGRYIQLLNAIELFKPQSIVEIGTWSGENAIRMIKQAQRHHKKIYYVGYDLFEEATDQTDADELNVKKHYSVAEVEGKIKSACPDANIHLIKGNTRETLKSVAADFVFLDGGHSLQTIGSDHERVSGSYVIVHDDYYTHDEDGNIPDISLYGCNSLVDSLGNGWVLPIKDRVRLGGYTQMVLMVGGK